MMKQRVRRACVESIQAYPPSGVVVTLCYGGPVSERFIEPLSQLAVSTQGKVVELPLCANRFILLERISAQGRADMGKLTDGVILSRILDQGPLSGIDCCKTLPSIRTGNRDVEMSIKEAIDVVSSELS